MRQILLIALLVISAFTEIHSKKLSHPYHVAITKQLRFWPWATEHIVGNGAIIEPTWIVTTAGVAKEIDSWFYTAKVKFGMEDYQWTQKESVEKVVIHEEYFTDNGRAYNDIALIKVKDRGFVFDGVTTFVLHIASGDRVVDGKVLITNWPSLGDKKEPLEERVMKVMSPDSCSQELGEKGSIADTQMCIKNTAFRSVGTKPGDRSALALAVEGNVRILVGIHSWTRKSHPGQNTPYPGVFTRIEKYNTWIVQNR